jgi:hypothetical protein
MPLLWQPREKAGAAEVMPLICSQVLTCRKSLARCIPLLGFRLGMFVATTLRWAPSFHCVTTVTIRWF